MRAIGDGTIAALRQQCGADAIFEGDACWRWAAGGVAPACGVEPRDVSGLAAAVRVAAAQDLALVPAGNGTHLGIGWPPRRYDLALSTRRLQGVVAHDAADLTVTVEAGVTIAALNAELEAAGQWLPIDPPRGDAVTVGGLIAANRSGPLRHTFGTVRDLLIGIAAVTADGDVVRGGGRVVKNVAGYDLPKLLTGSFGSLAIIVEASFKVWPRPPVLSLFTLAVESLASALARAQGILSSDVVPVFVEVVNEVTAEALALEGGAAVLVGCAGSAAHVEEQHRRLVAREGSAVEPMSGARAAAVWRTLRDFSQPADDDALVARVSARPADLAVFLAEAEAAAEAAGAVLEVAVHVGTGVAWCQLLGVREPAVWCELAARLRAAARRLGGWAVFEAVPAEVLGQIDPWGYAAPALAVMQRVKTAFDPHGRLSPGRFVGGM